MKRLQHLGMALLVAGSSCLTALGDIQVAGTLLVNVDATGQPVGSITSIANSGTLGGVFWATGGGGNNPRVVAVGGTGTKGIYFDGKSWMENFTAPSGVRISAPAGLIGINPTASIEVWVVNQNARDEETMVAWGKRDVACGHNMSFNYGANAGFGAVGHWCNDLGWNGTPTLGVWHHLVYTYDGTTASVYADGVLKNSNAHGLDTDDRPGWAVSPISLAAQHANDGTNVNTALLGSLIIAKVRVHEEALTLEQIQNNYNFELPSFTIGLAALPTGPTHRYSFSNPAGNATGATVTDLGYVGGANATVRNGTGTATFTGTQVTLSGGSSAVAPYVDLPNGLLSTNSIDKNGSGMVTIEGWVTQRGGQSWARIFDFGSCSSGEITGPGGSGDGRDYLMLTAQIGTDLYTRRIELANNDAVGGTGGNVLQDFGSYNLNVPLHYVVTWNELTGEILVYDNAVQVARIVTTARISSINDINVWLARSNWLGDLNMQGDFDEFRVYNYVLTPQQVETNFLSGPDTINIVPPPGYVISKPATAVGVTTATLRGHLISANGPTDVTIFYGTTDGGNNVAGWARSAALGTQPVGAISANVSGLTGLITYYYRCYGSNVNGECWSDVSSFTTLTAVTVQTLPASTVTPTYARLGGRLVSSSQPTATLLAYWGTTDGATASGSWEHVVDLGPQAVGDFAAKVSGLTPGMTYYYRYYASNIDGGAWASSSASFTTPALFNQAGYAYSMQVTFNGYNKPELLTSFPALVVLSSNLANFSYYQFQSGTADLRFVEANGGELNYDIESWDTNGTSRVWVQVPELTNGTVVTAFWGKAGMTPPTYAASTWNDGYAAVWHMSETNGTTVIDSTGVTANNGTMENMNPATDRVPAVVGNGLDYQATGSKRVNVTGAGLPNLDQTTVALWLNHRGTAFDSIFHMKQWTAGDLHFIVNNQTILVAINSQGSPGGNDFTSTGLIPLNTWNHVAVTYSRNKEIKIYLNGQLDRSGALSGNVPIMFSHGLFMGADNAGTGRLLNGQEDELQISSKIRSANWIWANYQNQKTPAAFETLSPVSWLGAPLAVDTPVASGLGTTTATLGARVASDAGNGVTSWGTVYDVAPAPTANSADIVGSKFAPFTFTQARAGLSSGTHYYFRGWASNETEGIKFSADGEFYTKPDAASAVVFSAVGNNGMTISWTPPASYDGSLVVVREAAAVTALPVDGTSYAANPVLERGQDLGGGQYVVYAGPGTSATVSGLLPGATYYVAVYPFAGSGSMKTYQTTAPATGSQTTANVLAGLSIAGELLIDMDTTRGFQVNETGAVTNWVNYGTAGGSFTNDGDITTYPASGLTGGLPSAIFNGANWMKASFLAPPEMTGADAAGRPNDYTVELWMYNPSINNEEWAFGWSRGWTAGRAAMIGYGNNAAFGVVAHWDWPDMGFDGGEPPAGVWHHIVVTYDGVTEKVYVDGLLNAQEIKNLLTIAGGLYNGDPVTLGSALNGDYTYRTGISYSGSITAVRAHSRALTAAQVANNYGAGPLNPHGPVSVVLQPQDRTVSELAPVAFSVVSGGEPPIAYQWYRNDALIDGATGSTYTLASAPAGDNGALFKCVVSNYSSGASCLATSSAARLTVLTQGQSLMHRYSFNGDTVDSVGGADGTLLAGAAVTATDLDLNGGGAYVALPPNLFTNWRSISVETWAVNRGSGQWARMWDFGNAPGVNFFLSWPAGGGGLRAIYNIGTGERIVNAAQPSDNTAHHIVFTQDGETKVARLYVDGVLAGETTGFDMTPADIGPTANNWFGRSQYADPYFNGLINELRIYNVALSPNQVAADYANGPDAAISVVRPVNITQEPVDRTAGECGDASFSLVAAGNLPVTYQWYRGTSLITDATNRVYTLSGATMGDDGATFQCIASNYIEGTAYTATSRVATLTVRSAVGSLTHRYPFDVDTMDYVGTADGALQGGAVLAGGGVSFDGIDSYVELPGGLLDGLSQVTVEFWASFGVNGGWSRVFDFGNQTADLYGWHYIFFSPHSGALDHRMSIADGDPVGNGHEEVVTGPGVLDGMANLHMACVWDPPNGEMRFYTNGVLASSGPIDIPLSRITNLVSWIGRSLYWPDAFLTGSVQEFRIYDSALSSAKIMQSYQFGPDRPLEEVSAPAIVADPQSRTNLVGTTATFSVRAVAPCGVSLGYQWFFGVDELLDETNVTLNIPAVSPANAGSYWVAVSTESGLLQSAEAVLTVNYPPVAADDSVDAVENTPLVIPEATLLANDTDADQVSASETFTVTGVSATSLFGAPVSLAGGNVTYTPPLNYVGIDTFTYTMSDGRGGFSNATVTVNIKLADLDTRSIASVSFADGKAYLGFQGVAGQTFAIQRKIDLASTTWETLGTAVAGPDGWISFTDETLPPGTIQAFYRTLFPAP
jgi:hypothetical protein